MKAKRQLRSVEGSAWEWARWLEWRRAIVCGWRSGVG